MTPRRGWLRQLVLLGAASATAMALASGALAQPLAAAAASPSAAVPAAYVDQEIKGLAPDLPELSTERPYNAAGLPRFLRLETRLSTQPFSLQQKTRPGFSLFGLLETPNHGTLSVDGSLDPREQRGSLTLRQRGMPWAGGWLANHELGVINTPAPDITRLPSRIFVPSTLILGAGAEWNNPGRGLQLQAAAGTPGQLEGLPSSAFTRLQGQRSSLGAQWHLSANANANPAGPLGASGSRLGWTAALRAERARGISPFSDPLALASLEEADATQLVLLHEGERQRIQGQFVNNNSSRVSGARHGFWVDSEWSDSPRRHSLGVYRLEPELSWAGQPLPSDLTGAYARSSWRTRQWSAEGSVDLLRSITGRAGSGSFVTGSARWRLASKSNLGAGFSLRRFDGSAWDSFTDWRFPSAWGASGLRLELAGGSSLASRQELIYDQDWAVPEGFSLATSLGAGRLGSDPVTGEAPQDLWRAALSLRAPVGTRAQVSGNLSTEQGSGNSRRWGVTLGASWRIDNHWSLDTNLNRSQGRSLNATPLDPLAPPLPNVVGTGDRSFFAVLRYELQAGSRDIPLGGRATDGGGRVEGLVYFDANKSGNQEANERGVPNVTVFLDNRYGVRTDAQGRFEFPFVAAGVRTVSVRGDTLPLPWVTVGDGQTRVEVRLRETSRLSIPVQRLSD
jgi:hypothetical protein